MTIQKYVLFTSFICFFMFFSNSFIYSENTNDDNFDRFKVFKGFNIQILKDMKTSSEMVAFISRNFGISKEDLKEDAFTAERIAKWLLIKPEKVKDVSPKLLEETKKKIIIYSVCAGIMAESVEKLEKLADNLDNLTPDKRDLLTGDINAIASACAGTDLPASLRYQKK